MPMTTASMIRAAQHGLGRSLVVEPGRGACNTMTPKVSDVSLVALLDLSLSEWSTGWS